MVKNPSELCAAAKAPRVEKMLPEKFGRQNAEHGTSKQCLVSKSEITRYEKGKKNTHMSQSMGLQTLRSLILPNQLILVAESSADFLATKLRHLTLSTAIQCNSAISA